MRKYGKWSEQTSSKFRTSSDNKEVTISVPTTLTGASNDFTTPNISGTTDTLLSRVSADQGTNRIRNKDLAADNVLFVDNSDVTKKMQLSLSGITTSTTRTITIPNATTTMLGTDNTATVSNKTLDNSNSITVQDSNLTVQDNADNTKQLNLQLSGITTSTTRTLTIPDADDTIAVLAASQTLTNKTIDADSNTITNIENADIKSGAAIDRTKLASGNANWVLINNGSGVMSSEAMLDITRGGTGANTVESGFNALSPLTTKGDIIAHTGSTNARLGVGTDGFVLTADSAQTSGLNWTSVLTNPMDSQGDLIIGGAGGAATKLDLGTADYVVKANTAGTNTEFGQIVDASVSASAAIAGTKISPAFGSQNISNTGSLTTDGAATFNDSGAAVDFRVESDTKTHLLFVDGSADSLGINVSAPAAMLHIGADSSTTGSHLRLAEETGVIATNDGLNFDFADSTTVVGRVRSEISAASNAELQFHIFKSGLSQGMVLSSDKELGIAVTDPSARLHVGADSSTTGSHVRIAEETGTIATNDGLNLDFADSTTVVGRIRSEVTGGGQVALRLSSYNSGLNETMLITHDQRVGISGSDPSSFATTYPSATLDVHKDSLPFINILDDATSTLSLATGSSGSYIRADAKDIIMQTGGTFSTHPESSGTARLTVKQTGVVQIHNLGSGTVSSDASGNLSGSDGRYKDNVADFTDGMSVINSLRPRSWKWKEDSPFDSNYTHIGFVAQEVATDFPAAAPAAEDEDKIMNFDDRALIAALVNAVKELEARIETLENN